MNTLNNWVSRPSGRYRSPRRLTQDVIALDEARVVRFPGATSSPNEWIYYSHMILSLKKVG